MRKKEASRHPSSLRASFSLLKLWERGLVFDVIKQYFRFEQETTEAMRRGKSYHKRMQDSIEQFNTCELLSGRSLLGSPVVEERVEVSVYPWLSIVGVIDCYDPIRGVLYEWKTGQTPASTHIESTQVGLYGWLLKQRGIDIERVEVWRKNFSTGEIDGAFGWMTESRMDRAFDWAQSLSYDLHQFFESSDIYQKYGHRRSLPK